tara:strand:+ start:82 stop:426 length:345 start_codon:yes stop_codon:yes gene_type:complete
MKNVGLRGFSLILVYWIFPVESLAGLDAFTSLVQIDAWQIERKVESNTNKIICRASIPGYGAWFSQRIRLDQNDQLMIPSDISQMDLSNKISLKKVKEALKTCRAGMIYFPYNE